MGDEKSIVEKMTSAVKNAIDSGASTAMQALQPNTSPRSAPGGPGTAQASATDISMIAATLAAGAISRIPSRGTPALDVVNLYQEILLELQKARLEAPNVPMWDAGTLDQPKPVDPPFYESENGDTWCLIRDLVSGAKVVMHQPNARSGGKISYIDVDQFLRESPTGPQHQALRRLIDR